MARVPHYKLYTHPRFIDLEFRNAYKLLAAAIGEQGPRGAAGAAGADGADATNGVLCLKKFIYQNDLATGTVDVTMGTLPDAHMLDNLFLYIWDWTAPSTNFQFGYTGSPTAYYDIANPGGTQRVLPVAAIFAPIGWMGDVIEEERTAILRITNNVHNGGSAFACINYISIPT